MSPHSEQTRFRPAGAPAPLAPTPTEDLLGRIARHSEGGFAALVGRAERKLRVLLAFRMRSYHRSAAEADDVLQEVWLEAARRLPEFEYRGRGSLERWLAAILHHKLAHAGRTGARVPRPVSALEAGSAGAAPASLLEALCAASAHPSRTAALAEDAARVAGVLEGLPAGERDAVLMLHYEGLTGVEAAARAGVDPSTISLRYRRALATCARRLREDGA